VTDDQVVPSVPPEGLKLMPGTASKRAQQTWKTKPAAELSEIDTDPPYELIESVAVIYAEIVAYLESMNRMESVYRHLVADYAECVATVQKCSKLINQTGLLLKGARNSMVANKLIAIRRDARAQAIQLGRELGVTPRSRIEIYDQWGPDDGADNVFAG
jgi:P27 family predicted phage terminase small subunit